jgi:hypothetical protein
MRDIRRDLQDRAHLLEEEINAAHVQFDKQVEQLKAERDAQVQLLKDELAALGRLMEAEERRMDGGMQPAPAPVPSGQQALVEFVLRKLTESGPMTMEDLRRWSLQEGFFTDPEAAARGMHTILMAVAKGGRIRQLPNGTFAPALLMDQIRQRQAI